jgi:hypothetical protein
MESTKSTHHLCDRRLMYELARIQNQERYRPPPRDIGECDWHGMSDDEILSLDDHVCPKHSSDSNRVDKERSDD